jgi:hypothetical protein
MLQIDTSNSIIINHKDTKLKLAQSRDKTVIYTPESATSGHQYKEHAMPYARYSATHDAPSKPGHPYDPNVTAGRAQLKADVLTLLETL